jgi:CBS domain-containing protein
VEGTVNVKSVGHTTARESRLELRTEKARVVARVQPATVAPGTSLRDAMAAMRGGGGDAVLVRDGSQLVGILTERDILTRVLGADVDTSQPVDDFMSRDPHTMSADATLVEAMAAMESGHYRNVPLIDSDGSIVALLRQQDLLEYVAEAFPQEILNLPPRPHQTMEEPEGA